MSTKLKDSKDLPRHLGLILDGNRRWASDHGLPKLEGHRIGYENFKNVAKYALKLGIKYVSAYIFSMENWNRDKSEVKYLMDLALWVATHEVDELDKEDIRVRFLGSETRISEKIKNAIDKAEKQTKNNQTGTLALCFNYGGQQEIAEAFVRMSEQKIDSRNITIQQIEKYIYAPDIPSVDLIIRTSGEQRLSNFMLWRAAYSELYFVNKHWPDFSKQDLDDALADYASRQRRFGK
jgi:undecaprenyl diphosphate synthase